MATKKIAPKAAATSAVTSAAKKPVATKPSGVVKKAATVAAPAKPVAAAKPIKTAFNKTSLMAHLVEQTGVDAKAVKAVVTALEATMLASVHKKGLGEFTMPGLYKVNVVNVPAKKKRTGIDPFTKQERMFAAKPATVKIKVRALKKLKDAAL